jgi:hypothetical protein
MQKKAPLLTAAEGTKILREWLELQTLNVQKLNVDLGTVRTDNGIVEQHVYWRNADAPVNVSGQISIINPTIWDLADLPCWLTAEQFLSFLFYRQRTMFQIATFSVSQKTCCERFSQTCLDRENSPPQIRVRFSWAIGLRIYEGCVTRHQRFLARTASCLTSLLRS